jgi:enolase
MARIVTVTGRQILDSQGKPTVEATVQLDDGAAASSSAPSGSVPTKDEAVELRDHISNEYFGTGVSKAVANINTEIRQKLIGMDPLYQTQVDQALVNLDGTTNKSRLGANAILAVSQAVMKAAAASLRLPLFVYVKEKYQLIQAYRLPTPIFNLINGGRHGSGTLDFQEFQLVPASHLSFPQSLRIGVEMFMAIDKTLEQKGAIRAMGVEGGFSPNLAANADALEIFAEAIRLTPYTLAQDAFLGLDVGPRWFYKSGKYTVKDRPQPMTGKELVKYFEELHQQFRVFAFEDPLLPDAWADWKFMTAEIGKTAMIIADDLTATNKTLLMKAIQEQACNAVVIKPNRVGTITEAIEIISLAKQAGWHTIMSHRSGETTDDILADIAVGVGTDYVKFGAPARGERVVKYNRLSRIAEILDQAQTKTAPAPGTSPADQPIDTANPDKPQFRNNTNTPDPNVTPVSFAMAAPGAAVAAVTNREQSAAEFMKQTPVPIPSPDVLPNPAPVSALSTTAAPTMASRLAAMSTPTETNPPAESAPVVAAPPTPTMTPAPISPPTVAAETDDLQENLDALVQQLVPTPVPTPTPAPDSAPSGEPAPAAMPAPTPIPPAPISAPTPISAPIPAPVPAPVFAPAPPAPSPSAAPALTLGPTPGAPFPTPTATFASAPTAESLSTLPSQPTVNLPPSVRFGASPTVNPSPAFAPAPAPAMETLATEPTAPPTPPALSFAPAPTMTPAPAAVAAPAIAPTPMAAPSATAPSTTAPGASNISSFTPVYPGYSPDNGSNLRPPTPPPTT